MARTALTVNKPTIAGLAFSPVAANVDGNSFLNNGSTLVYIKNGGGAPITVTIPTPGKVDGVDLADPTVSVGAGAERIIGGFSTRVFNQADGTVHLDYSGVASVTVVVFSL